MKEDGAIRGGIFDMDGTLINSLIVWEDIWSGIGKKFLSDESFRPSLELDKAVRTVVLDDAMALINDRYSLADDPKKVTEVATEIIRDFYENKLEPKDGVVEFLKYLQANGVKLCIASASSPELVRVALRRCGIEEYFCGIVTCEDVGKGKDHPDVFLAAKDFLGTDIDDTFVFEDSFVALESAKRAGFKTVGVYDRCNFEHGRLKEASSLFIGEGADFSSLMGKFKF